MEKVCQAEEAETDYRLRRRERFDLRGEADLISQGVKSEVKMSRDNSSNTGSYISWQSLKIFQC